MLAQIIDEYGLRAPSVSDETPRTVVLKKALGEAFGFKISTNPGVRGVTISNIVLAGVADRTGQLAIGDVLLKVSFYLCRLC